MKHWVQKESLSLADHNLMVNAGLETICPDCDGFGKYEIEGTGIESCVNCHGRGWIPTEQGRAVLMFVRTWEAL